ncbi:MAG TPA: D-2-hydroxyacid dehydrogenase [Steroidobacteraceae bacterium]|nr:D-2-hydroxyacid dehydrogenase [Steroidobacteraceae bacterium]
MRTKIRQLHSQFFVAFLWLAVTPAVPAQTPPAASAETNALIAKLGLHEAEQPVRESKGWHKPALIVVRDPGNDEQRAWLQAAAPGTKVVFASDQAQALKDAAKADAMIGFCSPQILAEAKRLYWIQALGAGVESCMSIPGIADRNLLVTNMQRVAGPVMAEHVIALTFALARDLPAYISAQASGRWQDEPRGAVRAVSLEGKTMFIAGLGGIGEEVARRAHALGMRVTATRASSREGPDYVSHVGLPDEMPKLLAEADVVVNTLPLTEQTKHTFDARSFAAMKPGAFFINVGRGGTVVTDDLVNALKQNRLGGAGLDVTDPEPLPPDHPLWHLPNVIITPHVSSDSEFERSRHWEIARENLRRYVAGERMLSVVDVKRGY